MLVHLVQGAARGRLEDGVAVFRGLPYAAPPFGALRFAPPAPPRPWSGERDCSAFGATAPRPPYPDALGALLPETPLTLAGEDCLNLNVWTPDVHAAGLPVLVWIHGGNFEHGSGSLPLYAGATFARDGVVTVTINYRLGVDGFARVPGAPDNRGLLDQIAALRWVQENIGAFGGDPARVTVAGESAGADSVAALCAMPTATGLFARAIVASGSGHHGLRPATAEKVTAAIAQALGVPATAQGLSAVPLEALSAAQGRVTAEILTQTQKDPRSREWRDIVLDGMCLEPVVDGNVLPARPYEVIAAGRVPDVELMVGSNDDEHGLFLTATGVSDVVDEATVRTVLDSRGAPPSAYDAYDHLLARPGPGQVLVAASTDWYFRVPALRLAEQWHATGRASYVYQFGWSSPAMGGRLGACHYTDVAFVFDTLSAAEGRALLGQDPPQVLADDVHAAWVAFVRDGDPGWPAYGQSRSTRRFGGHDDGAVLQDPDSQRRALWAGR